MMNYFSNRKKWMAYLILLTFVFTCIVPTNFVGGNSVAWADITQNQEQIENFGGKKQADGVTVSKTIEPSGTENYFDITLTVDSKKNITQIMNDPDMAVVIVMDISNTMNNAFGGSTRYNAAMTAAEHFLDEFAKANNGYSRVGYVAFNRDAKEILGLSRCTEENVDGLKAILREKTGEIISNYDDAGNEKYTNIEAGLKKANDMLASASNENKYIIFLSDGFPTTYIEKGYTGWDVRMEAVTRDGYLRDGKRIPGIFHDDVVTDKNGYCLYGTSYSDEAAIRAKKMATTIKNGGTEIFSIGIDIGGQTITQYDTHRGDSFSVIDRTSENYEIGSASDANAFKNWLRNSIGSGYYYDSTNTSGLQTAFNQIFAEIQSMNANANALKWIVADPMPTAVDFIGFYNNSKQLVTGDLTGTAVLKRENTASFKDNSISWDMKQSGFTTTGSGSETTYHYELKYRVRLENELSGFVEHQDYVTNGTTTLTYQTVETVNGKDKFSDDKTIEFPIPAVEGYLADLEFTKVDQLVENSKLEGAEFTLTHVTDVNDPMHCTVCESANNYVAMDPVTVKSKADGKVSFTGIPSGHNYVLVESDSPEGYQENNTKYKVTVAYDAITLNDQPVPSAITNTPDNVRYTVTKNWDDADNQDGFRPEAINVQLQKYVGETANWNDSANVKNVGEPVELTKANVVKDTEGKENARQWQHKWENIPTRENGQKVHYRAVELTADGKEVVLNGAYDTNYNLTEFDVTATSTALTNKHVPETVALQLNKVWKGDENIVAKRPTAVQFAITGKVDVGTATEKVVYPTDAEYAVATVATADNWTKVVELPKRSAGKVITYFVEEMVKQPFGYDVSYTVEPIGDTEVTWSVAGTNYNATTDSNEDADCKVTATNTLRTADIMLMKDYVGGTYDTIVPDDAQAAKFTLTTDEVTDAKPIELTRMGNTYKTTGSALQYGVLYTLTETLPKDSEYIAAPDKYLELTADANGALQVVEYVDKNRTPAVDENNNVIAYKVAADGYIKGLAKMGDIQNYTKDSKVDLFGTKSWVGGTTDAAVTLTLYKDGVSTNQTTTASADTEWKYEFKELPRYDENGKTFAYTVVETPIAGYTPYYGHVTTPGGITIDIVNVNDELGESPMGEIWVQKTTNTNDATTEYGFELHVTALIDNRTELGEEMEKQHDQLESELEKAQAELKAALDVRNERGAMLLAITDTNVEKRQTFVTTTSGSSYKFFITEADGVTANLAVTTGSALQAIDTIIVTPDKDQANAQWFIDALRTMKNVIAEMAENFVAGKENRAYTDALMERIIPEVQVATGSAIAFTADNLVGLYDAEVALAQAKVNYNKAEKAVFDFHAMMTSPSALTLVIDKDFNNPIHLKDPVEGKTYDVVINGKATTITFEDKHYKIPFTLVKDQRIDFYMEATSGSMVEYHIAEVDDQDADYTDITTYWDDKSLTVENVFRTIPTYLTTGTAYGYVFYNEYASGDNPNPPQTIEEEEPPTGSEDPDEPGNPDEWIPDGSVPTGGAEPDPLDELNDPDIPLGDAAATGDTNNAVPYVVLMMFAFAGLVFTRRRFN